MSIFRVKAPFAVDQGGIQRVLRAGDLVDDADPAFKGREAFFEPVEVEVARAASRIEQASAAPGEKRNVSRRRAAKSAPAAKRAAAKPADKPAEPKGEQPSTENEQQPQDAQAATDADV